MLFYVYIIGCEPTTHKLTYSKTIKGDIFGASLGLLISLVVAYLGFNTLGGVSVCLNDLVVLT